MPFTPEHQDMFEAEKLPTLDFEMQLICNTGETYIKYNFFKKPMSSEIAIVQSSVNTIKSWIFSFHGEYFHG